MTERSQTTGYIPWQHKIENKEKYEAWLKTITEVNRNPEKLQKSKVTYIKNKPFRKKFHQTNEAKSKLSEIRSKAIEEMGQGGFLDVKYYSICNILGEEFKVRGTWELKYADFLNKNNILWIRKLYIKYTTQDGVIRTYTPDFYLPSKNEYIEVKGYFSDEDKNKIKYVIEQNDITIKILMFQDLINLGIDLKNTDIIYPTKKSKSKNEKRQQGLSSNAINSRINMIKNSLVDFNKKGWSKDLAYKLSLHPTYVKRFMKKYMNDFYLTCRKY